MRYKSVDDSGLGLAQNLINAVDGGSCFIRICCDIPENFHYDYEVGTGLLSQTIANIKQLIIGSTCGTGTTIGAFAFGGRFDGPRFNGALFSNLSCLIIEQNTTVLEGAFGIKVDSIENVLGYATFFPKLSSIIVRGQIAGNYVFGSSISNAMTSSAYGPFMPLLRCLIVAQTITGNNVFGFYQDGGTAVGPLLGSSLQTTHVLIKSGALISAETFGVATGSNVSPALNCLEGTCSPLGVSDYGDANHCILRSDCCTKPTVCVEVLKDQIIDLSHISSSTIDALKEVTDALCNGYMVDSSCLPKILGLPTDDLIGTDPLLSAKILGWFQGNINCYS